MRTPSYTEGSKKEFFDRIRKVIGNDVVTAKQLNEFIKAENLPYPHFLTYDKARSVSWGKYYIGELPMPAGLKKAPTPDTSVGPPVLPSDTTVEKAVTKIMNSGEVILQAEVTIPKKDPTFIKFGFFDDMLNILRSKIFYPVYVTGLSGNGKTVMVEQACAWLSRELVRVNITKDTDELDLMGSYELVEGNTVYREGPVITAMKHGAVLLLDETDLGSERLLCLQPVLEGKPVLNKKTGQIVYPQPGFNIIGTANTKGKGSNDGRFVGANVLNEAFLERFAITVEQEYPNPQTETKILEANFKELGLDIKTNKNFITCLIRWAEHVRKSYMEGAVDEIIATRRLVHISKAFSIFQNKKKAINLCLNRFDDETKTAFMDLYTKIDSEIEFEEKRAREEEIRKNQQAIAPGLGSSNPRNFTFDPAGTPTGMSAASATSDIEYVPTAAVMTRKYGTQVVLKNAIQPDPTTPSGTTGIKTLVVFNNGYHNIKALTDLPNPTQVRLFEDAVARMVETNMAASKLGNGRRT